MLDEYEQKLLEGWENIYKKAQLTFWILLALKDGPKHMAKIKAYMNKMSNGSMDADDKSMYRALRRFSKADMVTYHTQKSKSGPDRKIYKLSDIGESVLREFIGRNVNGVSLLDETKRLFG